MVCVVVQQPPQRFVSHGLPALVVSAPLQQS